ncbi:hypothetical protein AM493_04290 [Flavobacterium akiainvivens]|uniref:VCBS repeat-containing protein n=1 Tax=Flavobacterium akiainvivens TaxID=1202724 RepID=A0A0M8M9H9_9FLAO|nr:hypothetical protein [Flavobacterium akiainvivens]KOS05335.1 hypothetical protein AM493_04290 [Flavobacterium akiainvivens]SFQ76662.1 hypothetical protein SAMN05444144_12412 [Flavobacterium akiainvivens]
MKHLLLLLFTAIPYFTAAQNGYVALEADGYLMFSIDSLETYTNVTLKGKKPLQYRITLVDEVTALLSQNIKGSYIVQDTIPCDVNNWQWQENAPIVSSFRVTDFNNDGHQDLVCINEMAAHGNAYTQIFLNSAKDERLVKLIDAETNNDYFSNPEYDDRRKILITSESGGIYGYTTTKYRIIKNHAQPFERTVAEPGEDEFIERNYTYKNGNWISVK